MAHELATPRGTATSILPCMDVLFRRPTLAHAQHVSQIAHTRRFRRVRQRFRRPALPAAPPADATPQTIAQLCCRSRHGMRLLRNRSYQTLCPSACNHLLLALLQRRLAGGRCRDAHIARSGPCRLAAAGCRYSCQFAAPSRLCHTIPAAHSREMAAQVSHQLAHAERTLQLVARPGQAAGMRRAVGSNPPRAAQAAADPRPQRARKRRRHHPSNTDAADDSAPIFCFCLGDQLQQFSLNALTGGL